MLPLSRATPFASEVWKMVAGRGSVDRAASILRKAEQRHRLTITGAVVERCLTELSDEEDEQFTRDCLNPFLSETHLVISGGDFCNMWDICNHQGRKIYNSWRAWSHTLAEWANLNWIALPSGIVGESDRKPRKGCKGYLWEYIDFYMDSYAGMCFRGYRRWVKAINDVLACNDSGRA